MAKPKVSVIMPTYNRADFIGYSIKSVLGQSMHDLELIVIDDGSNDETAAVVKAFSDDRLRYYVQGHSGEANARNNGLEKSKGEWISFCDSDDYWFPDRLAIFLSAATDEDCLAYSGWIRFVKTGNGYKILNYVNGFEPDFNLDVYQYKNLFPTPAVMAKKACFEKAGNFDPQLTFEVDWELFLRISDYFPIYQIKRPTVFYQLGTIDDPKKQHHKDEVRAKSRLYIGRKRIELLMAKYKTDQNHLIAKKILLASRLIEDHQERTAILTKLKSFAEIIDIYQTLQKNPVEAFHNLGKLSQDKFVDYWIKNRMLNFECNQAIFDSGLIKDFAHVLDEFFK